MSSVENMISEIESQYRNLKELISDLLENYQDTETLPKKRMLSLLRLTMRFHRHMNFTLGKIKEYENDSAFGEVVSFEQLLASGQKKPIPYIKIKPKFERVINIYEKINNRLIGKTVFENIETPYKKYGVKGTIENIRESIHWLDRENIRDHEYHFLECASYSLRDMELDFIEFQEELRYIALLNALPIEDTIRMKEKLIDNSFQESVYSLEEAEKNLAEGHLKDVISRCRDAVEAFISTVYRAEFDEEPSKYFTTDIKKIVNGGIYEDSLLRILQGVYGWLSLKGSHKYDDSRITPYDVEYSLRETYSLLQLMLNNYIRFKENK